MVVTIQMCRCTPTGIFYVLPDHSTNADCPSQPGGILSRYLLNINMSNIKLLFLSGKHTLTSSITMQRVHNVTTIGVNYNNLAPATIFCSSAIPAIIFANSSNITVANLVFKNCGGYGPYNVYSVVIATAFFSTCYWCNVTNVKIIGYGLAVHNLLGESYLNNIIIHLRETSHSLPHRINQGIDLINYGRSPYYVTHNLIYVSKITIIIDSDKITSTYDYNIIGIHIQFQTDGYNTTLMLSNSNFHYIKNFISIQ